MEEALPVITDVFWKTCQKLGNTWVPWGSHTRTRANGSSAQSQIFDISDAESEGRSDEDIAFFGSTHDQKTHDYVSGK